MIHFDTNFLIDALVPGTRQEQAVLGWLNNSELIGISSLAWGEFLCGPFSNQAERLARQLFPVAEPFAGVDGEKAAALFNLTGRRSKSFADCCIAAVAIRMGAKFATSNISDFAPFARFGLSLA